MGSSFVATWLRSETRTFAVCGAAGSPGMVDPMALLPIPSHQSQLDLARADVGREVVGDDAAAGVR